MAGGWNKENMNMNMNGKKHRKSGSTVENPKKPRKRHTNSMVDLRIMKQ